MNTGKLPDNLTTWEIEAIVTTADTKVGRGEATITTRKPVMISENLPRFFRTGDSMELAPVIFNQSGKKQNFIVTLQGSGITFSGNSKISKNISLEDGASIPVSFEVIASDFDSQKLSSHASLELSVQNADGEGDTVVKTLPVFRSETYETVTDIGVASGNPEMRKLDITGIQKDRSELQFQVSSTLF